MEHTQSNFPTDSPSAFGDYEVLSYLGHGSYGHVYRVFKSDDVEYAIKWLRSDVDENGSKRFQNEIWALSQLDHPSIPKLIDQGEYEGRAYFVMTLANGISLRSVHKEQLKTGGAMAQVKVVSIVKIVLDALAHMHSREIFHRDVKDDNIIVSDSFDEVSLIDLGFCRGVNQPSTNRASFWHVGAGHYSPPSKLNKPTDPHPTHDVFAVGVLAYLLLTNRYPWQGDDSGKLLEQMLTVRPIPVREINNLVSKEISAFIEKLLVLDDDDRPTAEFARDDAENLLNTFAAKAYIPYVSLGRMHSFPRVARDPLYGDIRLTNYEWKILNSPEFQRLRRIKQLGFSHLVYFGAEHSRMTHALGVLHITEKIMQSIEDTTGITIDIERRLLARCYALTHDVTHIAFGHTLEDELSFYTRHDSNFDRYFRLFLSEHSKIGDILKSTSFGRQTMALLDPNKKEENVDIAEIVEGSTGADVLDYIDRDSYFCGLDHKVDSAVFRRFTFTESAPGGATQQHLISRLYGVHGVRLDAEFGLESILVERFALFMKVYTHPAKIAAGAMLGKALADVLSAQRRKSNFDELYIEQMGDYELLLKLRDSPRLLSNELATRLLQRQLFKPAFRARALKFDELNFSNYYARIEKFKEKSLFSPEGRKEAEVEIGKQSGVRSNDIIVYVPPNAPGLQKVRQYIETEKGKTEIYDDVREPYQSIVRRHLKLWTVYIFVPESLEQKRINQIGISAENYFGISNEIQTSRRQGVLFDLL